jgi:hypothetical protein
MWQRYLMGIKFLLVIDNGGVKHMFIQHDLIERQVRWKAFLSEFDFQVQHIEAKENKFIDALSRKSNVLYEVIINKEENYIEDRIKSTRINDEKNIKTIEQLQRNDENMQSIDLSIDKSELLRLKNRLYVPKSIELKMIILDELHKKPYYGHPIYQKMITTLRKQFY